jgi:hypothetical protein
MMHKEDPTTLRKILSIAQVQQEGLEETQEVLMLLPLQDWCSNNIEIQINFTKKECNRWQQCLETNTLDRILQVNRLAEMQIKVLSSNPLTITHFRMIEHRPNSLTFLLGLPTL